jgi:8-oxo-dGTP pyrophosphatase MutT (NUDIX family)
MRIARPERAPKYNASVPDETNPWRVLSAEARYDNAWITVTHHEVLNPAGGPGIYGSVHYKNLAIGVIPIDAEGNTWLVGQYRFPTQTYTWEIPEGGGNPAHTPLESAQRELLEETGIRASRWRLILSDMQLSNSVSDELAYIFIATDLSFGASQPEETEALTVRKLPVAEAIVMAKDGRITDAMSVAGLLRLRLLQLEGGLWQ